MPFTKYMDTGTRSFRKAFKNGSCSDWPLATAFSFLLRIFSLSAFTILSCAFKWRGSLMSVPTNLTSQQRAAPLRECSRSVRVNALERRIGPDPGELTLGELPRCSDCARHGFGKSACTGKMRPQLAIADRTHRRTLGTELRAGVQGLDLA